MVEIGNKRSNLEGFEELDEAVGGELFVILGGDLDADLQVLANVGLQHGAQALERVFHRKRAEVVDQPLGVEQVRVHHGALHTNPENSVSSMIMVVCGALFLMRFNAKLKSEKKELD